ncbi:MAG: hypothetical protein ACI4U0_04520 [Candidatus Aphodocola sp.]
MANKKYTLYFKGTNKYGHEYDFPIVSLPLRKMDIYTSNYKDYNDLFNSLPTKIKNYIENNLCYDKNGKLENNFFITDDDFNPIMEVIFNDDIDVLYVTTKELEKLIINQKMSYIDFQKALMKTNSNSIYGKKYYFFKSLYEEYVKDKKILCMIDDYDVKKNLSNLDNDNIIIASIATDEGNIRVLSKKISQTIDTRRSLTFMFKKLFSNLDTNDRLVSYEKLRDRKNADINIEEIFDNMNLNFNNFIEGYNKEYD